MQTLRIGGFGIPHKHRAPFVLVHHFRAVFNAFIGTVLRKPNRRPSAPVLILRGFAQGVPTAKFAREQGCNRMRLLKLRHQVRSQSETPAKRSAASFCRMTLD